MAVGDYIFRLLPQAGDSAPHDEVTTSAMTDTGTSTLVDVGDEKAWQFSGGLLSLAVTSRTPVGATTGSGATFAIRLRINTYPAAFQAIAGYAQTDALTDGQFVGAASGTFLRTRYSNIMTASDPSSAPVNTIVTIVSRVRCVGSGADFIDLYRGQVGRSGTAPDASGTATLASSLALDTVAVKANVGSEQYEILDMLAWAEELSDADCAAVADDLRGTIDGAPDVTAPVLSSPTSTATGATTATGTVSTDEGNGTLFAVVTTSPTAPSAAQVQAGQDHTGSAAAFAVGAGAGQSVSGTGVQNVSATGLSASTTYYWHYQHQDAATNDSTVASSASFTTETPDTTAPVLSSPTAGSISTTSVIPSVTTDEGNGTLYWVIVPDGDVPSVAQIKAGQQSSGAAATKSGNQAVSGTGVQTMAEQTGLSIDTPYELYFVHTDAASNDSTAATVGFATLGLPSITTSPIKNNTGTVLASTANAIMDIYAVSTGALVLHQTGLTTAADGTLTVNNAALSAGTTYTVVVKIGTGTPYALGIDEITAA